MRGARWSGTFVVGGMLVPLFALGCASAEGSERAGAEMTTSVVTTVVTSTVEEDSPEASAPPPPPPPPRQRTFRVARVVDGDTLDLAGGRTVRLVQIDTPETSGECYGREASDALGDLLPAGTRVRLERDPALDEVDRYGRILRYVFRCRTNINLALVQRGAASVWFYDGDRGRYAERLLVAAGKARAAGRGAWGSCRATLDPTRGFETRPRAASGQHATGGNCAAGYDPCLPVTGDLDCADVEALGRAPVRVAGSDPYRLDGDGDGWGCE